MSKGKWWQLMTALSSIAQSLKRIERHLSGQVHPARVRFTELDAKRAEDAAAPKGRVLSDSQRSLLERTLQRHGIGR